LPVRRARITPTAIFWDQHKIPLTVFDLTLDRMYREAGIRTTDVFDQADKSEKITQAGLKKVANTIILKYIAPKKAVAAQTTAPEKNMAAKKTLLMMGDSISPETAKALGDSGLFDIIPTTVSKYQNDENYVEFFKKQEADFVANTAKIKGAKVVIVQSTGKPVSDHVQNLLELIHTAKAHGAAEVTAVIPCAAFSRQDRAFDKRLTSIGADLFAKQLKAAGADNIITFTMHSQAAIQFYKDAFGDKFTNISAADAFISHFKKDPVFKASDLVIGAPDGAEKLHDEGQRRACEMSQALTGTFNKEAMFRISKVHTAANETKITHFDGDVAGKDCVIVDDMVDGGTTMLNAAKMLKANGAKSVTCCFTHAVLSDGAGTLEKLLAAETQGVFAIDKLVMTDSIPESAEKIAEFAKKFPALARKIEVIYLGEAIAAAISKNNVPANANKPQRCRKLG
jgi:ribose-phosphate pyrophosphokinase